ncbi:MAG TPA: DUF3168 domain-containing protein [Gemmatimonadales bacterium]|nr:DUF3168 domain-containing protein [Gemmatimonadales bacterium]
MTSFSAAWPIDKAVAATLTGDATLSGLLAGEGVYSQGTVARDAALPYIVLAGSVEGDTRPAFQRPAWADGELTLDIYGADKGVVLTLYGHARRLLDRVPLDLSGDGRTLLRGRLTLTATIPDPPTGGVHGIAKYGSWAK